jgi:hypothetical protein
MVRGPEDRGLVPVEALDGAPVGGAWAARARALARAVRVGARRADTPFPTR